MTANEILAGYLKIQALIASYENKAEKPTLDGFSSWLERLKSLELYNYNKGLEKKLTSKIND